MWNDHLYENVSQPASLIMLAGFIKFLLSAFKSHDRAMFFSTKILNLIYCIWSVDTGFEKQAFYNTQMNFNM